MHIVIGLDPGARGRSTGAAIAEYRGKGGIILEAYTLTMSEARGLIDSLDPHVLVIDSPLSHPERGPWRSVDLLARRLGLRVLPPGWRGMRRLVDETTRLLLSIGSQPLVLETHPSSVLRVAGCGFEELLERLGCTLLDRPSNKHERDAVIAACVGVAFLSGRWARIEARDGSIWLVDPIVCRYPPTTDSRGSLAD